VVWYGTEYCGGSTISPYTEYHHTPPTVVMQVDRTGPKKLLHRLLPQCTVLRLLVLIRQHFQSGDQFCKDIQYTTLEHSTSTVQLEVRRMVDAEVLVAKAEVERKAGLSPGMELLRFMWTFCLITIQSGI
jgi:hypothetical protein